MINGSVTVDDKEVVSFSIQLITLFQNPSTQVYYRNVTIFHIFHTQSSIKCAAFQGNTCISDYTIIPIENSDINTIHKHLQDCCNKYTLFTIAEQNDSNNNTY